MDAERLLEDLARSRDLAPFGELVEHDRERRRDLLRTLRALFSARGNASEAADRMFLHRNCMRRPQGSSRATNAGEIGGDR